MQAHELQVLICAGDPTQTRKPLTRSLMAENVVVGILGGDARRELHRADERRRQGAEPTERDLARAARAPSCTG